MELERAIGVSSYTSIASSRCLVRSLGCGSSVVSGIVLSFVRGRETGWSRILRRYADLDMHVNTKRSRCLSHVRDRSRGKARSVCV